jgi:hypothetical protein
MTVRKGCCMSVFYPYGPFAIETSKGLVRGGARKSFANVLEEYEEGLSKTVGCYVFSIKSSNGEKPWYVGKTEKMNFVRECFSPSKRLVVAEMLKERKKGQVQAYLLVRHTPNDKFSRATTGKHPDTEFLETMLIGAALARNPKLLNTKKTAHLRETVVPGIINSPRGQPSRPTARLKQLLDL